MLLLAHKVVFACAVEELVLSQMDLTYKDGTNSWSSTFIA